MRRDVYYWQVECEALREVAAAALDRVDRLEARLIEMQAAWARGTPCPNLRTDGGQYRCTLYDMGRP